MPTMKTKKSATKRIKMSATGKVIRSQSGKSHLNGYKSRGRKRNLRGTTVAKDVFVKTAVRMLQGN
ncbi:MAG TPA: 50S ribosomal protein L35 [Kiritimatiellia bacterium]|nr:50S ribosomal protein L35 [Kiritimatiellia bacterium]HPW75144.1 50S ribosomal protein L35 [Kiritimatiellia bacterium]